MTLAEVKVWDPVVVVIPKVEPVDKAIAPAEEFPIEMAPVEVPVLMFVLKLDEAFKEAVAPVIVKPAVPLRSPAELIVPVPVVEIFPEVVIASPEFAGERVLPVLDQYPKVPDDGGVVVSWPPVVV